MLSVLLSIFLYMLRGLFLVLYIMTGPTLQQGIFLETRGFIFLLCGKS